jgi:hypothetical protein
MNYFFELGLESWAKLALQLSIIAASVALGWFLSWKGWRPGLVGMCISGLSFCLLMLGIVAYNLEWLELPFAFTNVILFAMFETAVAGFIISMFGLGKDKAFPLVGIGVAFAILAIPCVVFLWMRTVP